MLDVMGNWWQWTPFLVGWSLGWLLLARARPLRPARPAGASHGRSSSISIVVPARDEATALPRLLTPLRRQLGPGDEMIVVDDHSTDGTGDVALAGGARVVHPPDPPAGWLGKPNACWHGVQTSTGQVLLFLDADVEPHEGLLDAVSEQLDTAPDALVSAQPWHRPGSAAEQLSLFFNVAALMGAGRFSVIGRRVRPRLAFGPVVAIRREVYERIGGHAHPSVRDRHTEDIALARRVDRVEIFTGRPTASFRMYPGGLREVVRGWTRSIATGAGAAPRWATAATAGWIWALAAAPFVGWWAFLICAGQCWVLGRKAGSFAVWVAVIYPVALAVFVVVLVRSSWRVARRSDVSWKGRQVAAR